MKKIKQGPLEFDKQGHITQNHSGVVGREAAERLSLNRDRHQPTPERVRSRIKDMDRLRRALGRITQYSWPPDRHEVAEAALDQVAQGLAALQLLNDEPEAEEEAPIEHEYILTVRLQTAADPTAVVNMLEKAAEYSADLGPEFKVDTKSCTHVIHAGPMPAGKGETNDS